ncbi:MAG: GreA/GreB family elongation factor [Lentisphaeria bacterium]|nr:GreA/GreB family elongation factor [Lentisphaeria bacterium]
MTELANTEITWENSRSVVELGIHVKDLETIPMNESHIPQMVKVFTFAANKPKSCGDFAKVLTDLWRKTEDVSVLENIIEQLPEAVYVWDHADAFVETSQSFSAKEVSSWFAVSVKAKGADWVLENFIHLPMKHYVHVETALGTEEYSEKIVEKCVEAFQNRTANADTIMWIWKKKAPQAEECLANARAILELLKLEVRGDFIKARKTLHNAVMSDEKFQNMMMEGGTPDGIARFIKAVKRSRALDKGEMQSLMVKIVRQFPEAKDLVVEKKKRPAVRRIPRITSFRSVNAKRKELDDIINTKIPANTEAIAQARSYGDLRENFEYKAAKDEQRLLGARRNELEKDLNNIIPTDFSDVVVGDTVVPGNSVKLQCNGEDLVYHILGLWDSDPASGIVSFETPIGKALIGKSAGTSLTLPNGNEATLTAIEALSESIKAWLKADQ